MAAAQLTAKVYNETVRVLLFVLMLVQAPPKPPPVISDKSAADALRELTADYEKLSTAFAALQKQLSQILDDEQLANRQAVADLLHLSDALKDHVDKGELELSQKHHRVLIVMPEKALFRPGQAVLTPTGRSLVTALAKLVAGMPKRDVQISAHTDGTKTTLEKGDFKLSTERALGILVVFAAGGVAPSRLSATGYGPLRPLVPNSSGGGREKNRRIEITLAPSAPDLEP